MACVSHAVRVLMLCLTSRLLTAFLVSRAHRDAPSGHGVRAWVKDFKIHSCFALAVHFKHHASSSLFPAMEEYQHHRHCRELGLGQNFPLRRDHVPS